MSESYTRICFLLAAAGYRESELSQFARAVVSAGSAKFVDDVAEMQKVIQQEKSRGLKGDVANTERLSRRLDDSLAERVTQLLIFEARMTKLEASEALRFEFMKRGIKAPPSLGKRSFSDWLSQLARVVPQSEILHLSTRIRNQFVHQSDTDWSLK
ncbi:hypothetical protein [Limnobacter profundi]|uniref:DUF4145 domain-containing protein n=1 Tax=Limnobacter profundi TaxID=2732163 RepID=A0ABX6N2X5_9BURK|nr:hypothetical protein [Limnobacter sp. SAORIC-580]QJR28280.1 hypothetical protein HKT17_00450 [Limnobacter sp. SAORIC-580]